MYTSPHLGVTVLPDPVEIPSTIESIQRQLRTLVLEQSRAREIAVYTGISKAEAKIYDQRANRISQLFVELHRMYSEQLATQS